YFDRSPVNAEAIDQNQSSILLCRLNKPNDSGRSVPVHNSTNQFVRFLEVLDCVKSGEGFSNDKISLSSCLARLLSKWSQRQCERDTSSQSSSPSAQSTEPLSEATCFDACAPIGSHNHEVKQPHCHEHTNGG